MPFRDLTKPQITRALRRLGELAQEAGTLLEVSLYGGAVFTVVYGSRESRKDIDAIIHPSELARRLAAQVAREQELPDEWLNDDVKKFLAEKEGKRRLAGDEFGPGLQVSVPTSVYLLAMKLSACRPPLPGRAGDKEDIEFLLKKMEIQSLAEAERVHERFFPHDVLSNDARELVESTLSRHKAIG